MSNYRIEFTVSPWLLLLIIPTLAITVSMFFIGKRRARLTVNRIISTVLQSIVLVLCIFAVSGIYFSYDLENLQNELVILVDSSFTAQNTQAQINEFIHDILQANGGLSQVSIVTFGYDQKVVLNMGDHDPEEAYNSYCVYAMQDPPEASGTDIAAALQFVWDPDTKTSDIISYPETAKILLISDGLQTDQDALSAVKRITMDGINVDTTFFTAGSVDDASIIEVVYPERNLMAGEAFNFEITLRSSYPGTVSIFFEDRNENGDVKSGSRDNLILKVGMQTVTLPHVFDIPGYHELTFRIQTDSDVLLENNVFYSYYDLSGYNRILILEKYEGESEELLKIIESRPDKGYLFVSTEQIGNNASLPVEIMAQYNEIILYNIAREDMTDEFEKNLLYYVNDLGGGMFTVGGFEKNGQGKVQTERRGGETVPVAHSYVESDLEGSIYESMLPVTVEPYTPPVGVVFVVDRSGSMRGGLPFNNDKELDRGNLIEPSIRGAIDCLDLFSPRDYVGVIAMDDDCYVQVGMTPMTQRRSIEQALEKTLEESKDILADENYSLAIEYSGRILSALPDDVERKHIVFLSDGQPASTDFEKYMRAMGDLYRSQGVTITVVVVERAPVSDEMKEFAKAGHGSAVFIGKEDLDTLPGYVEKDLGLDELSGVAVVDYNPTIGVRTPVLEGINESTLSNITLNGCFTNRAKTYGTVQVALYAVSSPLYAEWDFGKGRVGSLMIDLEGVWSRELLASKDTGVAIVSNIVSQLLMQVKSSAKTLEATVIEDNYRTQVNVYGYDPEEEADTKLVAIVQPPNASGASIQKYDLSALSKSGNRFVFENLEAGVYSVIIMRVRSSFDILSDNIRNLTDIPGSEILESLQVFRIFSYSKEYDTSQDAYTAGQNLMAELSTRETTGDLPFSKFVYKAEDLFGDYNLVHIVIDPRLVLIIIAIVLYLTDIALRRFKLKFRIRRSNSSMQNYYEKALKS